MKQQNNKKLNKKLYDMFKKAVEHPESIPMKKHFKVLNKINKQSAVKLNELRKCH